MRKGHGGDGTTDLAARRVSWVEACLQTTEYARVIVRTAMPKASTSELEDKVSGKMRRAELFE